MNRKSNIVILWNNVTKHAFVAQLVESQSGIVEWQQGCQIGFFDAKFHKFDFFRGRWRQKNCLAFRLFFLQYLAFFGGSSHMLSDWCLGFLTKILLKNVIITGFVRECLVYFLFKHVALPVIHHKLMQFICMSSSKWKSSYDKGRMHDSNRKRHFFSWRTRRPVIVQKMHIAVMPH